VFKGVFCVETTLDFCYQSWSFPDMDYAYKESPLPFSSGWGWQFLLIRLVYWGGLSLFWESSVVISGITVLDNPLGFLPHNTNTRIIPWKYPRQKSFSSLTNTIFSMTRWRRGVANNNLQPPKFSIAPEKSWLEVGRLLSYWEGNSRLYLSGKGGWHGRHRFAWQKSPWENHSFPVAAQPLEKHSVMCW